MLAAYRRLPPRHRKLVARWTIGGTIACLAVSQAFDQILRATVAPEMQGIIAVTVLPVVLAVPLFIFCGLKLAELALANRKLKELASTDALTGCLSRGAFSSMVDAWLGRSSGKPDGKGALLVLDADHFKQINDRFGHDQGDVALRMIADAAAKALRAGDLIGRMGGEEFGVFLPGADAHAAAEVAERLRACVEKTDFAPDGQTYPLSVSIGCAAFSAPVGFTEIFKLADERLYAAKHGGRNQVSLAVFALAGTRQQSTLH